MYATMVLQIIFCGMSQLHTDIPMHISIALFGTYLALIVLEKWHTGFVTRFFSPELMWLVIVPVLCWTLVRMRSSAD